jgi:hypothetical protein
LHELIISNQIIIRTAANDHHLHIFFLFYHIFYFTSRIISIHLFHIHIHDNQINIIATLSLIRADELLHHLISVIEFLEHYLRVHEPQFLQQGFQEAGVGLRVVHDHDSQFYCTGVEPF